jgi:hypothetical protein
VSSLFILLSLNETFEGVDLVDKLCFGCLVLFELFKQTLDFGSGGRIGGLQEASEIINSERFATVLILCGPISGNSTSNRSISRPHALGNAIRRCNVSDDGLANIMDQSHANALVLIEALILNERKRCHFCLYHMKHHTLGKSMQMIAMRHMWSLTLSGPCTPRKTQPARGRFLRRSMMWRNGRTESIIDDSIVARLTILQVTVWCLFNFRRRENDGF